MGILDRLISRSPQSDNSVDVTAGLPYEPMSAFMNPLVSVSSYVTRPEAMAVPAVARARGIIASTVAGLPLEVYNKFSGAHMEANRVINQPDPRVPGSLIYAWVAEDLWLTGFAYGQIMETYADGRIASWTRVAPHRITPKYNYNNTEIESYLVDGYAVPSGGVGSIIVFYGLDEGFLNKAGRTVRAALALEQTAEMYAKEPAPKTVLKSNGANLTKERISSLLSSWNAARRNSSTAFLNADVEITSLGFDPVKLQLNEARQYVALEIARHAGIPAYFLSAESTSMTYSNAISERKSLIDFSLRPILIAIEQRLSMSDFVTPTTQEVRFSLDDFLRGDPLQRAQVYQILVGIGAMSIQQVQEEEDLIDNGN
jgi:hypothetical protein